MKDDAAQIRRELIAAREELREARYAASMAASTAERAIGRLIAAEEIIDAVCSHPREGEGQAQRDRRIYRMIDVYRSSRPS